MYDSEQYSLSRILKGHTYSSMFALKKKKKVPTNFPFFFFFFMAKRAIFDEPNDEFPIVFEEPTYLM